MIIVRVSDVNFNQLKKQLWGLDHYQSPLYSQSYAYWAASDFLSKGVSFKVYSFVLEENGVAQGCVLLTLIHYSDGSRFEYYSNPSVYFEAPSCKNKKELRRRKSALLAVSLGSLD